MALNGAPEVPDVVRVQELSAGTAVSDPDEGWGQSDVEQRVHTVEEMQASLESVWRRTVLQWYRYRCGGCGGEDHVVPSLIVPIEAGGEWRPSNGVALCRVCLIAREAARSGERAGGAAGGEARRAVNIWMSRRMHAVMTGAVETRAGFSSLGSLIRFLMSAYIAHQGGFSDLCLFQDASAEVKINVWVDRDVYAAFQRLVFERGGTVADAVRALLLIYELSVLPTLRPGAMVGGLPGDDLVDASAVLELMSTVGGGEDSTVEEPAPAGSV